MTDREPKQPEALRLAEYDERLSAILRMQPTYAAELRRLHEVNAELIEALERIFYDANNIGSAHIIAGDALAKATGEQQ
jgi:hypothetical protein